MVAGGQPGQRQSQWHQVQELFVFSLQIVWFSHDSSSPEIVTPHYGVSTNEDGLEEVRKPV